MRPMLAVPVPEELGTDLFLPAYVSNKIDGVRAVVRDGVVLSKTFEPIPNRFIQHTLGQRQFEGLDGELTVGPPYDRTGDDPVLNRTMSGAMTAQGEPDFLFHIFDFCNAGATTTPFGQRLSMLEQAFSEPYYAGHPRVELLEQKLVHDSAALALMQEDALECGYEGLILRNPRGGYKFGRSTDNPEGARRNGSSDGKLLQEWVMLKLKQFSDGEMRITGGEVMMRNENEQEENALGLAKRSTAREGLVPAGVLGALVGVDCKSGKPMRIGSGFTARQRAELWAVLPQLTGALVRYRHFEHGVKDAPRHAVFDAFVHPMTVGEAL